MIKIVKLFLISFISLNLVGSVLAENSLKALEAWDLLER